MQATIELTTADDYAKFWPYLSAEQKATALADVIRARAKFNIALFGEGDSYQGRVSASQRYKHVDQPDGFLTDSVASDPEQTLELTPIEVATLLMWAFTNVPRVGQWFVMEVFGGQMPTILPPREPEPETEPEPEPDPVGPTNPPTGA